MNRGSCSGGRIRGRGGRLWSGGSRNRSSCSGGMIWSRGGRLWSRGGRLWSGGIIKHTCANITASTVVSRCATSGHCQAFFFWTLVAI
jgi:hypothetical protein